MAHTHNKNVLLRQAPRLVHGLWASVVDGQ